MSKKYNTESITYNINADNYEFDLPFDNSQGKDVFRPIEKAPDISDVDDDFKEKNCYKRDTFLRGANVSYPYTQEQIDEIKKCRDDIFYFIENYVKISTLDGGVRLFDPYQYQKNMIKMMDENRFTIFTTARQAGKCVHGDTHITIKNKKTNEVKKITMTDFMSLLEN